MVYNKIIIVTVTWTKEPDHSRCKARIFRSNLTLCILFDLMICHWKNGGIRPFGSYVLRDCSEYIWSKLKTKKDNSLYKSFIPGLLSLFYISSDFQFIHFYFGSSYWLTIIIYYCTLQNSFINRRLRKMSEIL